MNTFTRSIDLLQREMDATSLRYQVSANNLANSEVPDFKKLLIAYYEDNDNGKAEQFLKQKCYKKLN